MTVIELAEKHLAFACCEKEKKEYQVVVAGPDDVHEPQTELEALRAANAINRVTYNEWLVTGYDDTPMCMAIVEHIHE